MRLFVAVELGEDMRREAGKVIDSLRKEDVDVSWSKPENLHITLKFLGEVREDYVNEIVRIVSSSLKGIGAFRFSLEGAGYFGSPSHPKVIWLDVKEDKDVIQGLMGDLGCRLEHVKKDSLSPNVHVTIGRFRSGRNSRVLLERVEKMKDVKLGETYVKVVKLKSSVLSREGAQYSDMKVFNLE